MGQPTRATYLLDVVLSDMDSVHVTVHRGVSGHSMVLCRVNLAIPSAAKTARTCYIYSQADWSSLQQELLQTNWSDLLQNAPPDDAARLFRDTVLSAANRHIPIKSTYIRESTHPWVGKHCDDDATW